MPVQGFSVYDMLVRNAEVFAERAAVIFGETIHTFAEFLQRVDALATGLGGHGLRKGDRVCVLSQNNAHYLELYGACAKLGLVAYPVNWRLTREEVERIVERAAPGMMVVDESALHLVADWPARKKRIPYFYQFGPATGEGFTPFDSLYISSGAEEAPEIGPDDAFAVISTAAVDAVPRGAVLTHGNLVASNVQTMACMGLDETDCYLLAMPLYHIAGLGTALAVMHAGGANVVMPRFQAAEAVGLVDAHRVTVVTGFAPVLGQLLDAAQEAGSKLASIRHATGLETAEAIERLLAKTGAQFWSGFGQSETTGFVSLQKYGRPPGGAGRPAPLCRIKLVDGDGGDIPPGGEGEIVVRGPVVMKEYFAQPEVTAHTFRGGWHHTGDLGRFDEHGVLHYVGRKPEKELIKPGGENVYPAEVEKVILEVEGVRAVCVFGVEDKQWGEAIKAVVEADPANGLTAEKVIEHVGGRIARYKKPKWVDFTEEIPKTGNGDVDRGAVKSKWGQTG